MKLKNYCAAAAITMAAAASSQAATVFTDDFNYVVTNDFTSAQPDGGGWTAWSNTGGSDAGSGIYWGNGSWLEYNHTVALVEGDVILMDANINNTGQRANAGYLYGMSIYLWDGADAGTLTAALGNSGTQDGVANGVSALDTVTYTVTAANIVAGLDQVIFKYENAVNWGETYDVTADVTAVPEPSSAVLLGLGGLALILRRRK